MCIVLCWTRTRSHRVYLAFLHLWCDGDGDGDVWDRFGLGCILDDKTHERQHKMIENKQILSEKLKRKVIGKRFFEQGPMGNQTRS